MSFNFKRINLTIIDQLRSICKVSTDQWTDKDNLTVDMIIGAVNMARGYSTDSEELADVKFQRDKFERLAKEWMDAFDTLKVKNHAYRMKRWIKISDRTPDDGQEILAKFKHGIIECQWDDSEGVGMAYVWRDVEFHVSKWMPLELFTEWAEGNEES